MPAPFDATVIADLAKRLGDSLPPPLKALQAELEATLRTLLESELAKLDLVTRAEFEAQMRVLERTREKLEQLEQRLNDSAAR
jgi:BMFP domain-containing protein YqiC